MGIPHILFGLCLAMCVVVGITYFIEEPYDEVVAEDSTITKIYVGHGIPHPTFGTLQVGGPGKERHEKILWLGWTFGALQIVFFVACLALGATRYGKVGPIVKPLVAGCVGYVIVFTMLMLSYRGYMNEETHPIFLSLPHPTAWMLYGIWIYPVVFICLYMFTFEKNVWSDESFEEFHALMEKVRGQAQGEGA